MYIFIYVYGYIYLCMYPQTDKSDKPQSCSRIRQKCSRLFNALIGVHRAQHRARRASRIRFARLVGDDPQTGVSDTRAGCRRRDVCLDQSQLGSTAPAYDYNPSEYQLLQIHFIRKGLLIQFCNISETLRRY